MNFSFGIPQKLSYATRFQQSFLEDNQKLSYERIKNLLGYYKTQNALLKNKESRYKQDIKNLQQHIGEIKKQHHIELLSILNSKTNERRQFEYRIKMKKTVIDNLKLKISELEKELSLGRDVKSRSIKLQCEKKILEDEKKGLVGEKTDLSKKINNWRSFYEHQLETVKNENSFLKREIESMKNRLGFKEKKNLNFNENFKRKRKSETSYNLYPSFNFLKFEIRQDKKRKFSNKHFDLNL